MPEIVERAFTAGPYGGTARGVRLFNEEFIRPFGFGSNWSKLRIVLNIGVTDTPNAGGVNALLDMGVCSGTARGIGSANPVNYVGGGLGGGLTARYSGNRITTATVTGGWYSASGARHFTAQHGSTVDSYTYDNVGSIYMGTTGALNGVYRRQLFGLDIQRVSDRECAISNLEASATGIQCDVAENAMMEMGESAFNAGAVVVSAFNLQSNIRQTLNYSSGTITLVAWQASAGPLDALNIAWSSTSIPCIIWGISITKFA